MWNGVPAGNEALWGMRMGSNILPRRKTRTGMGSKSGVGWGGEQGGIPRPRPAPLTFLLSRPKNIDSIL
ncbi:uncharacterized protein DS421_6g185160 [Arachis hypogaea]|nr:uncharacterized protein DS421_6g185160 [Arachis hypogaea]